MYGTIRHGTKQKKVTSDLSHVPSHSHPTTVYNPRTIPPDTTATK